MASSSAPNCFVLTNVETNIHWLLFAPLKVKQPIVRFLYLQVFSLQGPSHLLPALVPSEIHSSSKTQCKCHLVWSAFQEHTIGKTCLLSHVPLVFCYNTSTKICFILSDFLLLQLQGKYIKPVLSSWHSESNGRLKEKNSRVDFPSSLSPLVGVKNHLSEALDTV